MPSVLITGANRGLGLEFVRQYAQQGYRVFATSRKPEPALTALAREHERISLHTLEVTDVNSVRALAGELLDESIDILLNNAGTMGRARSSLAASTTTAFSTRCA